MFQYYESAAQEQTELTTALFVHTSVCVLFLYDYILNLSQEVELFWRSTFSTNTIFYFICRYLPFSSLVFDLATVEFGLGKRSSVICNRAKHLIDVLEVIDNLAINAVLVIQTSALYDHKRRLVAVLGLFGVSVTVVGSFQFFSQSCSYDPPDNRSAGQIVTLFFQTIFPIVILASSLWKVIVMAGLRHKFHPKSRGRRLTSVIVFQTFCLAGVCVCRIFNAAWYFAAPISVNLNVTPFLLPIGGICIVHDLLSLKEVGGVSHVDSTNTTSFLLSTVAPMSVDASSIDPNSMVIDDL